MKNTNWRVLGGGLLILVGLLTLLETLNIFPFTGVLWGLVMGAAGLAFLIYLIGNRSQWWAIIPGVVLVSLSALILIDTLFPNVDGDVGGIIFLGGIGLAFWMVYAMNTRRWWAIIPAGVLTALAATVFFDGFTRLDGGIFFLFGLALTFALVALLPGLPGSKKWPWIPAGILFVISVLALFTTLNWTSFFWAVLLIVAGLFLIFRNFLPKKS
ncbi:MAG: hypothetical protein CL609_14230 [Anaerolineaceae bacterium]|nr:hypothetical protein [Anaerolineaceae bacterium]